MRCRLLGSGLELGVAMSGAEVAGDLVDATLVASVAEPHANAIIPSDGHTHETACLNCGATLIGAFCAQCGQAAHVHRTLAAFFHDLLHGVFHFEGRVWHTLPLLVLQPGQLTRRYIDGERARFVSPLALFLFCVFVMFATIQQTRDREDMNATGGIHGRAAVAAQLLRLNGERRALIARHADTEDIDAQITALRTDPSAPPTAKVSVTGSKSLSVDVAWIDAILAKVRENPALAAYKVEMHAYKYSWLLIPISVPFVWLLFPFNRRFPVYDHTVFVTYSLSFMTLLAVVQIVFGTLGFDSASALLAFAPPLHMYRQLRGAYGVSRFGALWRTAFLLIFSVFALAIFAGIIVAQSAD